jgi:hypothetical protein
VCVVSAWKLEELRAVIRAVGVNFTKGTRP